MDVFKLLNKSNCRECGSPTCLAFAAAVFTGDSLLSECPHIDAQVLNQYGHQKSAYKNLASDGAARLEALKQELQSFDLAATAQRVGGVFANGRLTVKIMGKDFSVDADGRISSDIHVHNWITLPFFDYLLKCQGAPVSGNWMALRELESGKEWANFFAHRCEKPFKKVADAYTDLFGDLIQIFNGKQVGNHYQSDISLVLHPLPLLPMLICYWKPDDGIASDLNIFFDAHAEKNLPMASIYALGSGLVRMFEKIALRHGLSSRE
jgi:hypothetical protein